MRVPGLPADELVPLWLKVAWTVLVLAVVVIYYYRRGPANFLWFSDIALISLVPGLWFESPFVVSLMTCAVLVPELLWNVSFFGRLTGLPKLTGIADYMFEEQSPLWLRAVSLFHVPLIVVLVWSTWRLGYDPGVYPWAVLMAWVVLPVTRWLTGPEVNINHVYRLPLSLDSKLSSRQRMLVLMIAVPLVLQLPAHLLLWLLFGQP